MNREDERNLLQAILTRTDMLGESVSSDAGIGIRFYGEPVMELTVSTGTARIFISGAVRESWSYNWIEEFAPDPAEFIAERLRCLSDGAYHAPS